MAPQTLSLRQLNRATLARQLLLGRENTTPLRAIQQLVAMQAQQPRPPFIGLWSRLENFRREQLTKLLHSRKVVRATTLRCTLHLMSAKDYVALRPEIQALSEEGEALCRFVEARAKKVTVRFARR